MSAVAVAVASEVGCFTRVECARTSHHCEAGSSGERLDDVVKHAHALPGETVGEIGRSAVGVTHGG